MNTVTCPDCGGEGSDEVCALEPAHEADTERSPCSSCGGRGEVPVVECPDCDGEGTVIHTRVEAIPEQGNVARDVDHRAPCLSCDGRRVKMDIGAGPGLVPLPPESVEEWKRANEKPMEAIR